MPTVLAKNLNTNDITTSEPKLLASGAKQAYLNYKGEKLVIQSAREMRTPFGFNVWGGDKPGNPKKCSVNLSFDGMESNPSMNEFYSAMKRLDEFMIDLGVKNAKNWFKKDMSRELVMDKYTPIIKLAKDEKYAPTIKLAIPEKRNKDGSLTGEFMTELVDAKRNKINDEVEKVLVRNSTVTALIDVGGIWISNVGYGITLRLKSAMVHSSPSSASADFVEDGDDVEEDADYLPEPVAPTAAPAHTAPAPAPSVIDAVMPEDDEEEEEEAPKPKSVIRRKVVPGAAKK